MFDRRVLLKSIAATGIGTAFFHRSAAAMFGASQELDVDSLKQAEWITGLELTDKQRDEILMTVRHTHTAMNALRDIKLTYDIPMAIQFAPTSQFKQLDNVIREAQPTNTVAIALPKTEEKIAFLPVHQLSELVRTQEITSIQLTNIYLKRLKKYAPMLRCVVTLTEELALKQAARADAEISSGKYRGPLHGIPWGAKDLIAVEGYPTSWGVPVHKDRVLDTTATVAKRLDAAGAVLVAKLSLGALAQGDKWFGGKTRNPWNPETGSSGSSAGSACSVVAGLVGFTLGSETLGSIVSPSIQCRASSLRPTFGRVSRDGCMPLSWSLDKIGPICRSMEDCALVFDAIHGADGKDLTAGNYGFDWPSTKNLKNLRVGCQKRYKIDKALGRTEPLPLQILKDLGCDLVEIELPKKDLYLALLSILTVESAAVFDDLLRAGRTEGFNGWDKTFRAAQYISAVDYVRAQRVRTQLIEQFNNAVADVDVWVNMGDLVQANFSGHPSVVFPLEHPQQQGIARFAGSVILSGHLNDDERLLAIASKFQSKITKYQERPDLDSWLEKFEAGELK